MCTCVHQIVCVLDGGDKHYGEIMKEKGYGGGGLGGFVLLRKWSERHRFKEDICVKI